MKQRNLALFAVCICLLAFLFPVLAAKGTGSPASEAKTTRKPQRIVALSPGNTELLYALGAGDRVVGVTSYSDYPEEAKKKPVVGGYHAPDVERIVALAPDLVLATGEIQLKQVRILRQAGFRVIQLEPKSMQEVLEAIDTVSEAIGEPEKGAELHQRLKAKLDGVRARTMGREPRSVFIEVWDAPLLTVGSRSFMNDLITQAGGRNVAADRNTDYAPCDLESIHAYDPSVYVVSSHGRKDFRSGVTRPELADLKAIREKQVFQVMDDILNRPTPRCFDGLVELARVLHPDAMKDWEGGAN